MTLRGCNPMLITGPGESKPGCILDLSHQSGKYAVAKGIENAETIEYLISRGCDIGQGYYLAMPMPLADYTLLLNRVPAAASAARVAIQR